MCSIRHLQLHSLLFGLTLGLTRPVKPRLNCYPLKAKIRWKSRDNHLTFSGAEDGTQTRDPQLGRLMLYRLSYFRKFSGQRWIRTTEGVSQQIYSLPHLATLVFAPLRLKLRLCAFVSQLRCKGTNYFCNFQAKSIIFIAVIAHSSPLLPSFPPARSCACSMLLVVIRP